MKLPAWNGKVVDVGVPQSELAKMKVDRLWEPAVKAFRNEYASDISGTYNWNEASYVFMSDLDVDVPPNVVVKPTAAFDNLTSLDCVFQAQDSSAIPQISGARLRPSWPLSKYIPFPKTSFNIAVCDDDSIHGVYIHALPGG